MKIYKEITDWFNDDFIDPQNNMLCHLSYTKHISPTDDDYSILLKESKELEEKGIVTIKSKPLALTDKSFLTLKINPEFGYEIFPFLKKLVENVKDEILILKSKGKSVASYKDIEALKTHSYGIQVLTLSLLQKESLIEFDIDGQLALIDYLRIW